MAQPKKWIDELIEVYSILEKNATYKNVYELIEERNIMNLTTEWKASVRRTIEDHSSNSANHRSVDYFKKIGHGHWILREKYRTLKKTITENIIQIYSDINGELDNTEENTRTLREINQLNRNKKIVSSLKKHYNYSCQICDTSIKLRKGNPYVEVHHLQPLGKKGPDIIENMIVVCPNCHIKLDYKSIELDFSSIFIKKPHVIGLKYLEYQNNI